ncbi:hypothetical protein CVT24_004624 [Panaeolus cyanescens]|uniref:Uncharacterized protein n=1 Tax=Panaeolus cyanescens TaxID=181874 RepID=A0A409YSI4_9AGAR|nr:hypothetical protein CVT24_004624 [Panaeolus cyanescens]
MHTNTPSQPPSPQKITRKFNEENRAHFDSYSPNIPARVNAYKAMLADGLGSKREHNHSLGNSQNNRDRSQDHQNHHPEASGEQRGTASRPQKTLSNHRNHYGDVERNSNTTQPNNHRYLNHSRNDLRATSIDTRAPPASNASANARVDPTVRATPTSSYHSSSYGAPLASNHADEYDPFNPTMAAYHSSHPFPIPSQPVRGSLALSYPAPIGAGVEVTGSSASRNNIAEKPSM